MAKSMREKYLEAKAAKLAMDAAAAPGVTVSDRKWSKLEHEADATRKELSASLERYHGITLDELQEVQ